MVANFTILTQLLIPEHNAFDKRGKIFCIASYLDTKYFQTMQAKFCWKFNLIIPRKFQASVCKQPQQEGRITQIWQEVDGVMTWQCPDNVV